MAGTCEQDIVLCDTALQKKKEELRLSDLALRQSQAQVEKLGKDVQEKEDKLSAWYRNPFLLIGLGVLGGVLITR